LLPHASYNYGTCIWRFVWIDWFKRVHCLKNSCYLS
jgi:hypothetical protein